MAQRASELEGIRGIGHVLAQRLQAAGLDSAGKIAAAGPEGLSGIKGLRKENVTSIVQQAQRVLMEKEAEGKVEEELPRRVGVVAQRLQTVAAGARERFSRKLAGERGTVLGGQLVRIAALLERLEGEQERSNTLKGLAKAERILSGVEGAGLRKLGKGVKKARRTLAGLLK